MTTRFHAFGAPVPDDDDTPKPTPKPRAKRKPATMPAHNVAAIAYLGKISDEMLRLMGFWADDTKARITTWLAHPTTPDFTADPRRLFDDWRALRLAEDRAIIAAEEQVAATIAAETPEPKTEPPKPEQPEESKASVIRCGRKALADLRDAHYLSHAQRYAVNSALGGEEYAYFTDLMVDLRTQFQQAPDLYALDGQGYAAIAQFHYFAGGAGNWYLTEVEQSPDYPDERRGFGLCDPFGDPSCAELGYVSFQEMTDAGCELDFHWTPKPLRDIPGVQSNLSYFDSDGDDSAPTPTPEPTPPLSPFASAIMALLDSAGHGDDFRAFLDDPDGEPEFAVTLHPGDPTAYLPLCIMATHRAWAAGNFDISVAHLPADGADGASDPCLTLLRLAETPTTWTPTELYIGDHQWDASHPAWDTAAVADWAETTWLPILQAAYPIETLSQKSA